MNKKKLENYQISSSGNGFVCKDENFSNIIIALYNRRRLKKVLTKFVKSKNKNYNLVRIGKVCVNQRYITSFSLSCKLYLMKNTIHSKKITTHGVVIPKNYFKILSIPVEEYNKLENIFDIKELIKIADKDESNL